VLCLWVTVDNLFVTMLDVQQSTPDKPPPELSLKVDRYCVNLSVIFLQKCRLCGSAFTVIKLLNAVFLFALPVFMSLITVFFFNVLFLGIG